MAVGVELLGVLHVDGVVLLGVLVLLVVLIDVGSIRVCEGRVKVLARGAADGSVDDGVTLLADAVLLLL